jgi:hypothetical protein
MGQHQRSLAEVKVEQKEQSSDREDQDRRPAPQTIGDYRDQQRRDDHVTGHRDSVGVGKGVRRAKPKDERENEGGQ